ncbi:MAG: hypothetical protein LC792_12595 [Actinobacteria bacterium]|nr:hypothetical protein [Actinomycetota bacterium]
MVVAVHDHLEALGVAHAFGGALALAYYAEPRGTIDVDANVFVPFGSAPEIVGSLGGLGFTPRSAVEAWSPIAGVRLVRPGEPTTLDLFFSLDERYDEIARRVRRFPFGSANAELPFLSAEDLALFKLSFGRDKDWVDLRRVVAGNADLDVEYIERQLIGLRGPTMYPRLARLRRFVREGSGA